MVKCLNCKKKKCYAHEGLMNNWHVDWGTPDKGLQYVKKCPYCGCVDIKIENPWIRKWVKDTFRKIYSGNNKWMIDNLKKK